MIEDEGKRQQHQPLFGLRGYALGCGVVLLIVVVLALPVLNDAREAARGAICYRQGSTLHGAISIYAADYDERLPPATGWSDLILPGIRLSPQNAGCPSRPNALGPFAYNKALAGKFRAKVNDQAPMIFESNAGKRNHSDLLESITRPHKGEGKIVLGGGKVKSYVTPPDARFGQ